MIYNSPNICTVTQTNEANVNKMKTYIMNDAIDWGGIITVTDRMLKILIFFWFATEMGQSVWDMV